MPRRLWLLVACALCLAALAAFWQWLAFRDVVNPEMVQTWLTRLTTLSEHGWTAPVLLGLYLLGSLVVFPLSIIVAATGLIFGTGWGLLIAFTGTMLASVVTYWVGHLMGRDTLERHAGPRLHKLSQMLGRRGVRTMVMVSLLPLAPFTITNLMAGASHIRFRDYLVGTALGIAPGLFAVTVIGSQLTSLVLAEDVETIMVSLVAILVAISTVPVLRRYLSKAQ